MLCVHHPVLQWSFEITKEGTVFVLTTEGLGGRCQKHVCYDVLSLQQVHFHCLLQTSETVPTFQLC